MPENNDEYPIHTRFVEDKEYTLEAAGKYLDDNKSPYIDDIKLVTLRKSAIEAVQNGDISSAMEDLESLRDLKSGIVLSKIDNDPTSIVIRDARYAFDPAIRGPEAHEMQYLNAVRSAMDIAVIHGVDLKEELGEMAVEFMGDFHTHKLDDQKAYQKAMKEKITELGTLLQENGISDAFAEMNIAKDFQNFNDTHSNVVTISSVTDRNGNTHTVTEVEVAMKGMLDSQKEQYDEIINGGDNTPGWYNEMPDFEKGLVKNYATRIAAGEHVIPTQLRQIAGMKNAFEKITQIMQGGELKTIHTSKHAGTLCSLAHDKDSRQAITDENAMQAQAWMGPNRKLHCNTLNSSPGAGKDPEIVKRTQAAMKNTGGRETNTPFNAFRYLGGADVSGVKSTLKDVANSLKLLVAEEGASQEELDRVKGANKAIKKLKTHLKPRNFVQRIFGIKVPKGYAKIEIDKLVQYGVINEDAKVILESAVSLRKSTEKIMVPIRIADGENGSLTVASKLSKLSSKMAEFQTSAKGLDLKDVKVDDILKMCASGKDRTGLAEHDETVHAIAEAINKNLKKGEKETKPKDLDAKLLASGHTAGQAGGLNSGGATVGCFGTKNENKAGLPASRKKGIMAIVEVTANSNKIKGKSADVEREAVVVVDNLVDATKSKANSAKTPEVDQTKTVIKEWAQGVKPRDKDPIRIAAHREASKIRGSLVQEGHTIRPRSNTSPTQTPTVKPKSSKGVGGRG